MIKASTFIMNALKIKMVIVTEDGRIGIIEKIDRQANTIKLIGYCMHYHSSAIEIVYDKEDVAIVDQHVIVYTYDDLQVGDKFINIHRMADTLQEASYDSDDVKILPTVRGKAHLQTIRDINFADVEGVKFRKVLEIFRERKD